MMNIHSKFETQMQVRPDDIDLFQHVHSSRYMDYVLAARYEQMARCYGMSWEDFIKRGLGWYLTATTMNFLRPLGLGDQFEGHLIGVGGVIGEDQQLARPRDAVDPHDPHQLPLRLGDVVVDARLPGDRLGGKRVVSRYHHGPDAHRA